MTRFGWRTVAVRAEYVNALRDWAESFPLPPKTAQIVEDALRDWFDRQGLPLPAEAAEPVPSRGAR